MNNYAENKTNDNPCIFLEIMDKILNMIFSYDVKLKCLDFSLTLYILYLINHVSDCFLVLLHY